MALPNSQSAPVRIERLPHVAARVGFAKSWIYSAIARGAFPAPLKIGRASGWDSRVIDAWIDTQSNVAGGQH